MRDAINFYVEHRREVVVRRTRFLLKKAEDRAEILEAYLIALANLDEFIRIIRDSKNRDDARRRLQAFRFPTELAKGLGILIHSQPSVQGDAYVIKAAKAMVLTAIGLVCDAQVLKEIPN